MMRRLCAVLLWRRGWESREYGVERFDGSGGYGIIATCSLRTYIAGYS
jgi:hypothetical protein